MLLLLGGNDGWPTALLVAQIAWRFSVVMVASFPMKIPIHVDIDPRWASHASYALHVLLDGAGYRCEHVGEASLADVVYSRHKPRGGKPATLWIKADDITDWNSASARMTSYEGISVFQQSIEMSLESGGSGMVFPDLVYSTYALLTGAFEQTQRRDDWGVVIAADSFLDKTGALQMPLVPLYAEMLGKQLARLAGGRPCVPRWPNGKRYAVVMSHDVDAPYSCPTFAYRLKWMRRNLRVGNLVGAAKSTVRAAQTGLNLLRGRQARAQQDPNFCFDKWIDLEASVGAKSCFYVAVRSSADEFGTKVDVAYDYRDPAILSALHRAISKGWEIGLHASICTRDRSGSFEAEKEQLERRLDGYKLAGVRHHYWALNANLPEETLSAHAKAGFEYDSSLGMNDRPGFRRGMAWPFMPFDRVNRGTVPIVEIPPTIMDGSIFYNAVSAEEGYRAIKQHVESVFLVGGAVVLDWHLEQLNPELLRGAGPILARVLQELAGDSEIYWTTPEGLCRWWKERSKLNLS